MGRILGKVALATLSLAITLLILECIIRFAGVSVGSFYINRRTLELDPNPYLQYRLRPGSVARAEVTYRINALGLRGPETQVTKPQGTRRIVISGDSIAFGYWVESRDAYPRQIESFLGDLEAPVEVINLGVPGYNLGQEFELLQERGLAFGPDLVIVSICLNDLDSIFSYEYGVAAQWAREGAAPSLFDRLKHRALAHSMLAAFVEYRLQRSEYRRTFATRRFSADDDPTAAKAADASQRVEKIARQRKALHAALRSFASLLRQNGGVPALVVLFPGLDHDFDIYPHAQYHEVVAEAAAASGLPFIDLLDCYSRYSAESLAIDPVHPSPLGHRIAAHEIVRVIGERGLIDAPVAPAPFDCGGYRPEDFPTVRGY